MTDVNLPKFQGLNNRAKDTALPEGKLYNAVNVLFADDGTVLFPRPGKTLRYAGDCKWIHATDDLTLFVEDGDLKRLNDDDTATTLQSGVGSTRVFYTQVADTLYWANELTSGRIVNGVNYEWGTARPPRQPDATPVSVGGLFAGEYRICITWIGSDGQEGGTGNSKRVTVVDGGGIYLNNFPTPPAYCSGVAIYISSVNSKDLSLYGEFSADIDQITLTNRICTVPLSTQFAWTPRPIGIIKAHYGRIYYAVGDKVYWTDLHNYGLQHKGQYFRLDSNVQVIISCPNVLYIGTQNKFGRITNIDGDGPAIYEELQDCATVKGSEVYHPDGKTAYVMSDRGWLQCSPEGVAEISYKDIAIPFFKEGTQTILQQDGHDYLIFVGRDATANPLANSEYAAAEALRGVL